MFLMETMQFYSVSLTCPYFLCTLYQSFITTLSSSWYQSRMIMGVIKIRAKRLSTRNFVKKQRKTISNYSERFWGKVRRQERPQLKTEKVKNPGQAQEYV